MTRKLLTLFLFFSTSLFANSVFDAKFGGTILLGKDLGFSYKEIGELEIKTTTLDGQKTLAKMNYSNPIFPQAFVLTPKHSLPMGTPLKRPFILEATLTVNGVKYLGKISTKEMSSKGRYDVKLVLNQKINTP